MKELQEQMKLAKEIIIDLAKFKHEDIWINENLQREQGISCDKLKSMKFWENLVNSFMNDVVYVKRGYNEANIKLTELLSWQKDRKIYFPNLLRINEMQKYKVLHAWKAKKHLA